MKKYSLAIPAILSFLLCTHSFAEKELTVSGIFAEESDAVVLINTALNRRDNRFGSGFLVSPDGLVVTNYHIIKNAEKIFIKLKDDRLFDDVHVMAFDDSKDIALLKIRCANLKAVTLGNSNNVRVGERVIAIGNPLGLESTVSDGLISSLRIETSGRKLLQISVPISDGSSGGPLFNMRGEVIGVTAAKSTQGENLNFAIPINYVKPYLKSQLYMYPEKAGSSDTTAPRLYIIKPKDTLYGLAKRFGTTVEAIMEANKLSDSKIYVGQHIKIPTSVS